MIRTVHVFQCGSTDLFGDTRPTEPISPLANARRSGGSSGPWRWRKTYRRGAWLSLGRNAMPRCGPLLRTTASSSVKPEPCRLKLNRMGRFRNGASAKVLDFFVGHLINVDMTRQPAP